MAVACGGHAASGPAQHVDESTSPSNLVAAAKSDGSLLWYSGVSEDASNKVSKAFSDKYGIDVQVVRISSAQLISRYSSEAQAGAPVADLVLVSLPSFIDASVEKGWMTPLADAGIPGVPESLPAVSKTKNGNTAAVLVEPAGFVVNTSKVAPEDRPKSWQDIADPRWKGKIVVPDVNSSVTYINEWYTIAQKLGDDFVGKVGAQGLGTAASGAPAVAAVAAGEYDIGLMALNGLVAELMAKGAPVEFVLPQMTTGFNDYLGLTASAKHPNAAKLFAQYLYSEEGAATLADAQFAVSPFDPKVPSDFTAAVPEGESHTADIKKLLGVK